MGKRKIEPVHDNADKQRTYAENMKRYGIAVANGFYFEAMLIVYAVMEDRMRSFLYHAGALKNENSFRIDHEPAKAALSEIVTAYKKEKETGSLTVSSISGKRKVIRCLLEWAATTETTPEKGTWAETVKDHFEGTVDAGALLSCLEKTAEWCEYRNEVIHALMNKNLESLHEELSAKTEEGMRLARDIDSAVRVLKRGGVLRKKLGLSLPQKKPQQRTE